MSHFDVKFVGSQSCMVSRLDTRHSPKGLTTTRVSPAWSQGWIPDTHQKVLQLPESVLHGLKAGYQTLTKRSYNYQSQSCMVSRLDTRHSPKGLTTTRVSPAWSQGWIPDTHQKVLQLPESVLHGLKAGYQTLTKRS